MSCILALSNFAVATIIILAGLALVWLAAYSKLQLGEASRTALLLLPLLVYLIVSGKLTAFEVQGLKAEFQKATSEKVIEAARVADLAISNAEANEPDFTKDAFWQLCRPYYVLSKRSAIKPDGSLDTHAVINIAKSIRAALICGKFQGIAVVDSARKPIGFIARDRFLELLALPLEVYGTQKRKCSQVDQDFCDTLFKDIKSQELGVVLLHPEERAKSEEAHKTIVGWNATLFDAYKKVSEGGVELAMIADRHGRFDGIITRTAIESRVVGRLIEASK